MWFSLTLRRQLCSSLPVMLAYYVHDLSPFILRFGENFGLRWYGFAYVMAFVCGYWLYLWLARRGYSDMPPEKVGDFITAGAIFGVMIGGRLGHVLFYDLQAAIADPLSIFQVWKGGMSAHGGMIGLILFTLYYSKRHKLSWTGIGDSLCVVAPIGIFLGRIANFINGELFGRVTKVPWAVQFPDELFVAPDLAARAETKLGMPVEEIVAQVQSNPGIREALRGILSPRHPSQIYEALLEGVVLFAVLWFLRTRTRQPRGAITGAFFIVYAIARIIGEQFREPEVHNFGFTRGQFLSFFLILIGAVFVVYGYRTRVYERAQSEAP